MCVSCLASLTTLDIADESHNTSDKENDDAELRWLKKEEKKNGAGNYETLALRSKANTYFC